MEITYVPPKAAGLTDEEEGMLLELWQTYFEKLARNRLKKRYYDNKNRIKDLGISIPPPLRGVDTVVGWPAKAVDKLAARSQFDGFICESGMGGRLELAVRRNNLRGIYKQATSSELINSCSFLTISKGDVSLGEPEVLISAYSALSAAALWDYRRKRIRCGFTVVDANKDGKPIWINLYTSDDTIQLVQAKNNRWHATRLGNPQGRPLMEPLVYRPTLDRPFGKSRISRAVMSITDSAVREALRTEISSEFFTAPQRYILGADEDVFKDGKGNDIPKYEAYLASIINITPNENGDIPSFGQLAQMTMQPHTEYMRALATRFAGETDIPVSTLGVIHDNPSSAQAMYAAKEDLVIEAVDLNETNGTALEAVGMLALAIMQNKTVSDLTPAEQSITANFKNPATPSIVSQADAMVKILSQMPEYAYSGVVLEELGFSKDKIMRLETYRRKERALDTLNRIAGVRDDTGGDGGTVPDRVGDDIKAGDGGA